MPVSCHFRGCTVPPQQFVCDSVTLIAVLHFISFSFYLLVRSVKIYSSVFRLEYFWWSCLINSHAYCWVGWVHISHTMVWADSVHASVRWVGLDIGENGPTSNSEILSAQHASIPDMNIYGHRKKIRYTTARKKEPSPDPSRRMSKVFTEQCSTTSQRSKCEPRLFQARRRTLSAYSTIQSV